MIDIYNELVGLVEKKLLSPQVVSDWQLSGDFQKYLLSNGLYYFKNSHRIGSLDEDHVVYGIGNRIIKKKDAIQDVNGRFYLEPDFKHIAFYNGRVIKTSYETLWKETCKLSRHFVIRSDIYIPFAEHSGAGFGTPKTFMIPCDEAYGIEIETLFNGDNELESMANKIRFCLELNDILPAWIVERDGSLEDGIKKTHPHLIHACAEIVSPPLGYDDLVSQLKLVVELLKKYSATADYGDYFAIHITSNIPSSSAKLKMLQTVMAKENRLFWLSVSGRPEFTGFNSDSPKPYCQFVNVAHLSSEDQLSACSYHGNSTDHYRALFIRNSSAAELRIFKTKIDWSYIMSIVELNRKLYQFSHSDESNFKAFCQTA